MATLLKYLLSLAVHSAWMRAGKGGAAPPLRMPGGKAVPLPVIGPWQMLLISWVARKLWQRYGDEVRTRVAKVDHPAAQRLHDWIPSTTAQAAARATSQPPATFTVPGTPAPAASAQTQHLPLQVGGNTPKSSLLSRLRKGA
jgi:hypothetical protein